MANKIRFMMMIGLSLSKDRDNFTIINSYRTEKALNKRWQLLRAFVWGIIYLPVENPSFSSPFRTSGWLMNSFHSSPVR